jgi:rhodanese-related sulfurtransferase
VPTITTDEAEALLDDGVPFIDVRTVEEFQDGHVPGAINIPINHNSPDGMRPNPDFVQVVEASFERTEPLIVACKAGGRSAQAARALENAGFSKILDMTAGFSGKKDAFGATIPGWQAEGREIEMDAEEDQSYEVRKTKAGL